MAVANPRTLDAAMAESMTERRVVLGLFVVFALTGLLLAGIGLYGVMAYAVATRRREFGVRLALGATPRGLIRHVLESGLRLAGVGVVLGLALAAGTGRLLASQLYQVGSTDLAVTFQTATVALLVAAVACVVPAWRASRLELTTVLAAE